MTAYAVGEVIGTVAGVVVDVMIGNVAAGSCGLVGTAARLYSNGSALAGMGAAAYKGYTTGHVGVSDAMAFLPAITWGVQAMRGVQQGCFVADTEVLTGSADQPGVFSEKAIQDVQVGDLVWTRADGDPSAPLELRPVLAVEEHVVYDLQTLSVQNETGNVEEFHVTDAHPFYADGVGWRAAVTLEAGMRLVSADGHELTVLANVDELRPEGVTVYNFTVESGHTYFVEDGIGEACWVWVHNSYDFSSELTLSKNAARLKLSRRLGNTGASLAAHHVIPLQAIEDPRTAAIIRKAALGGFDMNGLNNGMLLDSLIVHRGSHRIYNAAVINKIRGIGTQLSDVETARRVQEIADMLKAGLANITFHLR